MRSRFPTRASRPGAAAALLAGVLACCGTPAPPPAPASGPYLVVLGEAQDGGWPQAGCRRACCREPLANPAEGRVASLGLVEPASGRRWLFDATPDLREQLRRLDAIAPTDASPGLDGIFLTHAHIGHYLGLAQIGYEVMGASTVPVYAMPRMRDYLAANGPWDQLVRYENIELRALEDGRPVELGGGLRVTPFLVPHRDEYSETVGFRIEGPGASAMFLPDIDKWERWETPVESMLIRVDRAWLDGTFFDGAELPGRDMARIGHPFIVESLDRFASLDDDVRSRIRFIHLNHTNPALREDTPARRRIRSAGMDVAREGSVFPL